MKLTTDRHEASRSLFAKAELLVFQNSLFSVHGALFIILHLCRNSTFTFLLYIPSFFKLFKHKFSLCPPNLGSPRLLFDGIPRGAATWCRCILKMNNK